VLEEVEECADFEAALGRQAHTHSFPRTLAYARVKVGASGEGDRASAVSVG
jgi:hypothetical protein